MSALAIHTFQSQRHAIFLLYLVFRTQTKSDQLSLNGIFMRLTTRHNLETGGQINEPLDLLVSWHAITSRGPSPRHLHGLVTPCYIGFVNWGFAQFPSMQLSHWWVKSKKTFSIPVLVVFPCRHWPYTPFRANDMQSFSSVWFFALDLE